jgi:lycopene beta-cyclase
MEAPTSADFGNEMSYRDYDLILVGGGLASGLIAYRLSQTQPELRTLIIEKGEILGGRHTWSFHTSDLPREAHAWLGPLVNKYWHGHSVHFPQFSRRLGSGYHSIRSERFHECLVSQLSGRILLNKTVTAISPEEVCLEDGLRLTTHCVLDGRGFVDILPGAVGFQKFFGLDLELKEPHGLEEPVLMDVTCEQRDGFRFFYVLPWTDRTLLVEDTHYSDSPDLNPNEYKIEIRNYARQMGWKISIEGREEVGCLPIPLRRRFGRDGDPREAMARRGIPTVGVRAGLFHATTGYSLCESVLLAETLGWFSAWKTASLHHFLLGYLQRRLRKQRYFRLLNRMLFHGAEPEKRFEILQRFYRLPEPLIRRFYGSRLTRSDYIRILIGRPPIPFQRAVRCLFYTKSLSQ